MGLLDLTLPGSHDSAAAVNYGLDDEFTPDADLHEFLQFLVKLAKELGIPVFNFIKEWALAQVSTYKRGKKSSSFLLMYIPLLFFTML